MGLDMYLRGQKYLWTDWEHPENNRKEDDLEIRTIEVKLGYWRKHPNLHGHIVETYADGKDECQEIELDVNDLRAIITAVRAKTLPLTEGFFFGRSDGSEDDETIAILEKAIAWVETKVDGEFRVAVYQASW